MTQSPQHTRPPVHLVTVVLLAVEATLLVGVNIRSAEQKRLFFQDNIEHQEITIQHGWPWWYRMEYKFGPTQAAKRTPEELVRLGAGIKKPRYKMLAANALFGLAILVVTALASEIIFRSRDVPRPPGDPGSFPELPFDR